MFKNVHKHTQTAHFVNKPGLLSHVNGTYNLSCSIFAISFIKVIFNLPNLTLVLSAPPLKRLNTRRCIQHFCDLIFSYQGSSFLPIKCFNLYLVTNDLISCIICTCYTCNNILYILQHVIHVIHVITVIKYLFCQHSWLAPVIVGNKNGLQIWLMG